MKRWERRPSVDEVSKQIELTVNDLEAVINEVDGTPGRVEKSRRDRLASVLALLFLDQCGLAAPAYASASE